METPEAPDLKAYPICKICDRGTLMPRKMRRLSGPAVAIGYILLIPSILGMAACAILLIVSLSLLAGFAGTAQDSAFATTFAGIGSIAFVYIGICSFVFGLLGWLLVMKKYVLQCGYCGAVVEAAAAVHSQPNRSFERARIFGFFFLLLILVAITVVLTHKGNIPAQPIQDNSAIEPSQSDTWKPFTSATGKFSILFPGIPQQSSRLVDSGNGKTITLYKFSVSIENIQYIVSYADFSQDDVGPSPDAFLQRMEKNSIADKSVIGEYGFDFNGVPARAFTTADSTKTLYISQEFLAGTRFYYLLTVSPFTPNHNPNMQFMNSFKIL